jgi:Toprim-like
MSEAISTKKCLICKDGKKNDCLHWHESDDDGPPWVWCAGKCQRAYSIYEYTAAAGLTLGAFLKQKFDIKEAPPNEVRRIDWPKSFIPLFDQRSKPALEYLKSRGIDANDGMYYDVQRNGIVFPYYFDQAFVGAQIRFIEPWTDYDGAVRKIDTIPGTRLGLLFYGWNQSPFLPNIKGVIVTEGAFNAKCIDQALSNIYGGILKNPWKCIAASGSGASKHQIDTVRSLKESGLKVVIAPDSDDAGMKMFEKFAKENALTHYAFTEDSKLDWNDFSQTMSREEFARWFLGRIKSV